MITFGGRGSNAFMAVFPSEIEGVISAMIAATKTKVNELQSRIIASRKPQQIRQLTELGTKELSELVVVLSKIP